MSNEFGSFDQTLNFEVVSTRRNYQLLCRGESEPPIINQEPRLAIISVLHGGTGWKHNTCKYPPPLFSFSCTTLTRRVVFPHCKRTVKGDKTVRKCYIIDRAEYCFGPLHCGKPREGYQDGRFPENMDIFNISNSGSMQANVQISLKNEQNSPTFILEPSTMTLEPGESQVRESMVVKL